jgi:hypothetical protein
MSPPGKNKGSTTIGIGGKDQPIPVCRQVAYRDAGLVFEGAQRRIVERADEHVGDQAVHRPAAAAVREVDPLIL